MSICASAVVKTFNKVKKKTKIKINAKPSLTKIEKVPNLSRQRCPIIYFVFKNSIKIIIFLDFNDTYSKSPTGLALS